MNMPRTANASRWEYPAIVRKICHPGLSFLLGGLLVACVQKPTRVDPYAETEVAQLMLNSSVEEGYLWQRY